MTSDLGSIRTALRELGTTRIAHLNVDLMSHMQIVHDTLRRFGRPDYIALAGLCHGIYGTHALHSEGVFQLPDGRREQIHMLVGERAERIVYNFCVMTYESLGKSVRNILKPDGQPELWDRCAGRMLDINREDLEDILWLKLADLLAHLPQLSSEGRSEAVALYGPFW